MSCVLWESSGGSAALEEAGHAEIALRSSLPCRDHPFGSEIGLGSCLIFITSPMHRKNAEGISRKGNSKQDTQSNYFKVIKYY